MHSQQTHSLALPILLISSFGISLVRVEATQKNFCGTYLLTYCRNCNVCSRGKGGCLFHLIDDNDSASHLSRTDLRGFSPRRSPDFVFFFVASFGNSVQKCTRNCKWLICLSILDIPAPIDKHRKFNWDCWQLLKALTIPKTQPRKCLCYIKSDQNVLFADQMVVILPALTGGEWLCVMISSISAESLSLGL